MRIYRDRFYVTEEVPGISGFQRWNEREYAVITGHKARNHRTIVVGELLPIAEDWYRIEDGHIPDYQERMRLPEALRWLAANPFQRIVRLDPETRQQDVKPHYKRF